MSDFKPIIVVDSREQDPLPIVGPSERGTLVSGDYSLAGGEALLSIERKSLGDLVQSLTTERERFTRELIRLRGYHFARLLIVGSLEQLAAGDYRSKANPKAMVNSLYSIEAKFLPVVFVPTPAAGAALVERWVWWFARSVMESARLMRSSQG